MFIFGYLCSKRSGLLLVVFGDCVGCGLIFSGCWLFFLTTVRALVSLVGSFSGDTLRLHRCFVLNVTRLCEFFMLWLQVTVLLGFISWIDTPLGDWWC